MVAWGPSVASAAWMSLAVVWMVPAAKVWMMMWGCGWVKKQGGEGGEGTGEDFG